MPRLDPDRLFPTDPAVRALARDLHAGVRDLPIVSPHGHCDPRWFAEDLPFPGPAELFVIPDHYIFRMLCSQGIALDRLGVPRADGRPAETDGRAIWRLFASNWHLFRATPSRLWVEQALAEVFDWTDRLSADTADASYDHIAARLADPAYRPRALFDRFKIEVLATTDQPLDDLRWHAMIRESGWPGRVITAYRPDNVVDPDFPNFAANVDGLLALTAMPATWNGYLDAHRARREYFRSFGATSTDHGHPTARTEDMAQGDAARLFDTVRSGKATAEQAEAFRGQMLTEMAPDVAGGRHGDADPSRILAQPFRRRLRPVRP